MSAFTLRKKMIVKKLKECNAVSKACAKTLKEAGVYYPNAFPKVTKELEKQNVLMKTKEGKYYVHE